MTEREVTDKAVAGLIAVWSVKYHDDPNRWSRTKIGQEIKKVVEHFGNWKNKPRGNPRRGYEAAQRTASTA